MRSRRLDSAENRSARFTAGEIAHACAGELAAGDAATPACGVATDTRRTVRGRAFFALVGDYGQALNQLDYAKRRIIGNYPLTARIEARQGELRNEKRLLEEMLR